MDEARPRFVTIKDLVLDYVHRAKGHVDYDSLTREVKSQFPTSRWQKTHWTWYRYQIVRGRFKPLFSEEERADLANRVATRRNAPKRTESPRPAATGVGQARGPAAKDDHVKAVGDRILDHVRFTIGLASGEDQDLRFKLNRWVFARLLQDEIRVKRPIKKQLWAGGARSCCICGKTFEALKGVEIHRKDSSQSYSTGNCTLICRTCHETSPS